ncbi:PAS domain-containing sensor histidine kinase [Ktedonobacter sp. SOSP1-85]|uniref:PAS domain-containing sensor histidine kinase n=1 Tax=Ktedonobacter sp. SOSP1-85 TaxID=2778367 RepID=UPI00191611DD|nr:PAS domain-containing sensor histidine kinase [Ktedonobacter sp. SOSP1-85]
MFNPQSSESSMLTSRETLLSTLETLPDALFVVDDATTIVYANASAQTMLGASREQFLGNPFWRGAPQLVSTALYQAVQKTTQTRVPSEVEYRSPVTGTWLHVQLAPTVGGLLLQFHQGRAARTAAQRQETVPQGERLYIDDLNGLHTRIGVLTPEGIVLEINEVPLDDAHIRREEVIGKPLAETRWWSCSPPSQEQLRAAIARASRGETARFETVVHPREGMDLHLEATIIPRRDVDHHVEYLVYVGTDITERKRAEAEIHALIDAIPQLVWTGRSDGSQDSCNQRWRDYTGLNTEEAQEGEGWMQCTHPEDRQRVLETWQRAVQTGGVYETELRLRHGTTGEYRWFLTRAMPVRDERGQILKWFGTNTDIEDRKQAEQQLKESREHLRVLAETVPQLVWSTGPDGLTEDWNQRFANYFHATPEQLRGYGWRQFLHPEEYDHVRAVRDRSLETGDPYEIEYRLKDSNAGSYRWFLARALPVRDATGQILKWFGTCTDIQRQKQAEDALRQSQERVNHLMSSSVIGIFFAEGDVVVEGNNTFLRMTGYSRDELCQRCINWGDFTLPALKASLFQQAHQELVVQQDTTPFEAELVCKDGSRLDVLMGGVAFHGEVLQGIGFVLDNSARKELEQRKDHFLGVVSHELKTPLTSLKLQTQLLRKQLGKQGIYNADTVLSRMEAQLNMVTRLVGELLDLSKIQAGTLEYAQETVNLGDVLQEVVEIMQQMQTTHTIVVHRAAHPPLLVGDKDRLEQMLLNLISNAIKYSPGANTIEVDIKTSEEAVMLSVHDQGIGIPREQREKIFERFYRAVAPHQRAFPGLGMGLHIASEIVKHHRGTITVESEMGKGSTFQVTLPLRRT